MTVAAAGCFADTPADSLDRLGSCSLAEVGRTAVPAAATTVVS